MRIGVLGAGQLGRMLALAGYPLGIDSRVFDPTPKSSASHVAPQIVGRYDDEETLAAFADGLDAVTFEFENVPVHTARFLVERLPVFPPPVALEVAQDRLAEKTFFQQVGVPTPAFRPIDTRGDLEEAIGALGVPAVLKTRRMGYDGKGQVVIRAADEVPAAWEALGSRPLIMEEFVPFEREVSIVAVRGRAGEERVYPLVENHHREGILRLSLAPAPELPAALQATAEDYARRVLEALDYVGVLAIEFFVVAGGLMANEMAPRVHNSGHWSIEGAETSQFENHMRAVAGLPLGSTQPRGWSAMLNLIGTLPNLDAVLRTPGAHLHLYQKEPRTGRKIGHVTAVASSEEARRAAVEQLRPLIP